MNVIPAKLTFHDVRLNQSDTKTLTITNTMSVETSFTLRPSSARYSIFPTGTFKLSPKESIVVSVRLMVDSYSNVQKGINGQEDSIMIKLPFDTQKIPVAFYLHNQYVSSRSPSPVGRVTTHTVKRAAAQSEAGDIVNTLNEQIRHKDIRISELESILGNVKSKYPGFDEIVAGRIRAVQADFEEKAKKLMDIMKEKDALVARLEEERTQYKLENQMYKELTQHDVSIQSRAEGHSHQYWSGRALPGQATGLGSTHQQLANMLEQTQKQLEAEKTAHFQSRTQLNEAHSEIEELVRLRDQSMTGGGRWQLQERKELSGLREQNLDQAEEIKTLSRELEKLRKEASEHRGVSEDLQHALREARRLKDDLTHAQQKYKQLEETHHSLQSAHEALEHLSEEQQQHLQQAEQRQQQSHQQQQQAQRNTRGSSTELSSNQQSTRQDSNTYQNNGRVSWHEQSQQRPYSEHHDINQSHGHHQHRDQSLRMDGQQFEESVGGGLATSTPVHYALHPSGTAQQAIHEKNAALSLYEDRMNRYEEEIQMLKDRIAEGKKVEGALKERLEEVESQLHGRDQEGRLLSERVERLKSEREATLHEAQDKDIQLKSALERVSQHSSASAVNDAHLWWAYIWHAMKQQQDTNGPLYHSSTALNTAMPKTVQPFLTEVGAGGTSSNMGSGVSGVLPGGAQPGSLEYKPPHDAAAAVHEARLRDNLRAQAIEIAQLRQELIGRKLTFKKEMDGIKEQNEHFQREIVRMQAQSRIHRADKDLKIEQLTATVRTLSVRGDMHAQAAAALQQVETEKLTNHQLRADLDSYRLMLEEEQRKVLAGRKECATLQAQIDSSLVLQSVVNVPGVSPATLIELMAGQITQLEAETAKSRQSAAEATQQLRALQRTVNLTSQRRVVGGDTPQNGPNRVQEASRGNSIGSSPKGPQQVPGSQRSRSLSPVGGRRASTGGVLGNSAGTASLRRSTSHLNMLSPQDPNDDQSFDDGYLDNVGLAFSPQGGNDHWSAAPFSVVVDGEATPKQVIDSLDRAVLAQRVASQEVTIAQLHDLVDQLQAAAAETDKELLVQLDEKTETERIEFEKCQRKQDLLQTVLDEHKNELKKLQTRNNELEKSLSDIHAARLVEGYSTRPGRPAQNSNGNASNSSVFYEEAPLMGNHSSDLGSFAGSEVNFEENQKELESTKILLRERTTQLRVVMETLDALQLAGVKSSNSGNSKFHAEDELLFNRRSGATRSSADDSANASGDNLYTSAGAHYAGIGLQSATNNKSLGSMEHTWGMQALIKRVVELTTELSSQCAHASLAARKAEDLELLSRRQAKEINHFKIHARTQEDAASRATLQLNSMCSQIQEGDRNYIDAAAALRQENEKLVTALRESEASLSACEIKLNALTQQATIADQSDFMGWLEFVTLDNQKLVTDRVSGQMRRDSLDGTPASPGSAHDKEVFNHKTIGESTVRDLVVTLVLQWKEYVGSVPQMKPLTTPAGGMAKLSKAEQRFLQRVTDLVLHSNDRATKAQLDAQSAAARTKQVEHANQVALERLKICASHLNRYRKRCHAFEQVLSVDRKHEGLKKGKLESMLRESLSDLRSKHSKALEALRSEKRDRMINDVKRAMETQQMRKLQAQIAELEARGTATLRARDEAVQSLEGKLKQSEESMFKWFKVELPRLVSGLPATEDALSSLYNENVNPNYGLDPSPFSNGGDASAPITNQLLSSMGMDRTYALAQALCASRASLTVHEMRISGLTEKLSVLKERNLSLESVLIRWKDEIQATHLAASVPSVQQLNTAAMNPVGLEQHQQGQYNQYSATVPGAALGAAQGYAQVMSNANKVEHAIQQVYSYADSEAALNIKVHELTTRLIELEEQNIELKGKCEQASARAVEMKALVDVVMNDEQQLKTKATQQLTKIRLGLEKEHSEELRRLRQAYETEKNTLLGELESVARAVEEAKLTSVDTTAWQRLVNAGAGHGDAGEDLQYATQPRPTPIRTYVPTPPHEEKLRHKHRKNKSKRNDDREGNVKEKTSGKAKKSAHRKSSKKRQDSSSSSETNSSSSSSSSSSDSDGNDSDSMRTPEDRQGRPRSRKEHRQSKHRSSKDNREPSDHKENAGGGAGHATSATAYAQTLRKQAQYRTTTASGRDVMDVRATPSSAGGPNQDSNTSISLSYLNQQQDLAEVQIENLERMLELERRRHAETKFEMSELQQLLDIQQAAFREHLNRDPPGLPAHIAPAAGAQKPSRHGTVSGPANTNRNAKAAATADHDISLSTFNETISVTSGSPPASERPESDRNRQTQAARTHLNFAAAAPPRESVTHILHEVQREDPALWPSLGNLLDELLNVLQGLSDRAGSVDDRLNVRTALAMAARVKLVCSSSTPADRNIPSTAAASKTGGNKDPSFHADQLFEELKRYSSQPNSRANDRGTTSSVRSGSSETRDHTVHLQSLANRVKMMESDFADDNIPERHLYLMRDLRMRVVEIEKTLTDELHAQQTLWASERAVLVRKAEESASLAEQLQQGQSESMSTMRHRYEDALKSAEEALESNTRAAKSEVTRLEQLLAQQTSELRDVRAALAAKPPSAEKPTEKASRGTSSANSSVSAPRSAAPAPAPAPAQKPSSRASTPPVPSLPVPSLPVPPPVTTAPEQHLLNVPLDNLNEFLRMQRLVNDTNDELDYILKQRQQAESNHAREVSELKGHFSRYRRAQAEVVRSLEDQLDDLQEQLASLHAAGAATGGSNSTLGKLFPTQQNLNQRAAVDDSLAGGPSLATNLSGLPEAEDVIRKMEFKYKVKTAELEAVMRTLSRMATGEGDTLASHDQSSFDNNTSAYSLDPPDLRPPPHPQHHVQGQYQPHHQYQQQPQGSASSHGHAGYAHSQASSYQPRHQYHPPSMHAASVAPTRSSREGGFSAGIGMQQHEGVDFGVLGYEHFDSVARDMQTELFEARIVTADKEIEALHRNLQKERNLNAQLKAQLQSALQQRGDSNSNSAARDTQSSVASAAGATLTAPKQSAEPILPSGSSSVSSQAPPAPEPLKARLPTRRGSTSAINTVSGEKAITSNAIPTFAPTGAAAPGSSATTSAGTHAGATGTLSASNDPIFDFNQEYVVPEVNSDNEKTRLLVRRMNEMRRTARVEISQLKEQIVILKSDENKDEQGKPKEGTIADLKHQLAGLREDNARKNKLLASMKANKVSEDNVLEQWKLEANQREETVKRLQRSISSKDAKILDLKAKVEQLELTIATAQREGVVPPSTAGTTVGTAGAQGADRAPRGLHPPGLGSPSTDITNMPAQELRARLRSSEADRGRMRESLTAQKENVKRLEAEKTRLQAENHKLQQLGEHIESYKGSIARKDAIIKKLHAEVENLKVLVESLRNSEMQGQIEADKRAKQLQREVDLAKRGQHELQHESQLMRKRLVDTDTTRRATSNTSAGDPDYTGTGVASTYSRLADSLLDKEKNPNPSRSVPPARPTAVQQRRAAGPHSTPSRSGTLEEQDDLQDVISALGVSPLHLGLGLKPRSSTVSEQYTHNASGRGSTVDRDFYMSPGEASTSSQEEVLSTEKRIKELVSSALQSPVKLGRL